MSRERKIVESLIERGEVIELKEYFGESANSIADEPPQAQERIYQADSLSTLLAERQVLDWTIEHWIETGTLALLVGAEGSFKSFLAVDWCMSIALGRAWNGCRVKAGRVLYIAGEGRTGVIRRMRGWCLRHRIPGTDQLLLGRSAITLVTPGDAERIGRLGKFDLVVIDTLARNFGVGNENDQRDMGAAIANADRIRDVTGATVLIVHHTPLEGREEGRLRPRGSSALSGAADAIFTACYDKASKVITISSTKQKDAPPPESLFLGFDVVDLGDKDNFGNPITTVVLVPTHMRPVSKKVPAKNQKRLIQDLRSRGKGKTELLVVLRDVTDGLGLSRESRNRLERWAREQGWMKPAGGGGDIILIEDLPDA